LLIALAVLYRYAPDRRTARWQWVSIGSVFAALAWIAGSYLFSWFLINFAHSNITYGSLGAAVGLMMWLWISLLGAELNAEIELKRRAIRRSATRSRSERAERSWPTGSARGRDEHSRSCKAVRETGHAGRAQWRNQR